MPVQLAGKPAAPHAQQVQAPAVAFKPSREIGFDRPYLVLEAPPGEGKTFAALSISEQWPDDLYNGPPVTIDDTVVIEIDRGGLHGLLETRVNVQYVIDLSTLTGEALMSGLAAAKRLCMPLIASGQVKNVILDTASMLDKLIQAYLESQYEGPQFWGAVRKEHMKWFADFRELSCTFIVCVHLMNKIDLAGTDAGKKAAAQAQATAQGRENPFGLAMDITGAGGRFLRDSASLILPLKKTRVTHYKHGRAQYERHFLPYSTNYDAKTRFTQLLDPREPANLRALVQKVQRGIIARADDMGAAAQKG